jgi:deoxyribonuclease I
MTLKEWERIAKAKEVMVGTKYRGVRKRAEITVKKSTRMPWEAWVSLVVLAVVVSACCHQKNDGKTDGKTVGKTDGKGASDDDEPGNAANRGNVKVTSFDMAKRLLPKIFKDHEVTFYCGCTYKGKKVNLDSCGYTDRKNRSRAERLEWEHVVPAHAFGQNLTSWKKGDKACKDKGKSFKGRKCAAQVSAPFRRTEADLYNLRPAIGEVNGDRSNFDMGEIPGEKRDYGKCDVEIDSQNKVIEPRPEVRGDVARAYLYMDWAYPNRKILNAEKKAMFEKWDRSDPPDAWEKEWAKRVERAQGNKNPFIKQ